MMIFNPLEQFEIHYYWMAFNNFNWVLLMLMVILFTSLLTLVGRPSLINDSVTDLLTGLTLAKLAGFVYFLFALLVVTNLLGMFPMGTAISSQLVYLILISMGIIIGTLLMGIVTKGWTFWTLFLPQGAPLAMLTVLFFIELMSYGSRAISLGLRLGANLLSGHLLVEIVAGLIFLFGSISVLLFSVGSILFVLLTAIYILELAIAFIQAYVFSILTVNYINDVTQIH